MARPAVIPWSEADTIEALHQRSLAEADGVVRTRLHALWLLRQPQAGWTPTTVAAALGEQRSSVQRWRKWYREGVLEMVCSRRQGDIGQPSCLTPTQQEQWVAAAATGRFATAQAVRDWLEAECGVVYSVGSLYTLLPIPRPRRPGKKGARATAEGGWVAGGAGDRVGG